MSHYHHTFLVLAPEPPICLEDVMIAATSRQRCLVHKQRNVLAAIPRREREDLQAELR